MGRLYRQAVFPEQWERMKTMFDFRIIICSDGTEIIDTSLKTPYEALTSVQMLEYVEMDARLAYMEMMARKAREEAERKRKLVRNPFYRLANTFGIL